jgi:hypothetical protein
MSNAWNALVTAILLPFYCAGVMLAWCWRNGLGYAVGTVWMWLRGDK